MSSVYKLYGNFDDNEAILICTKRTIKSKKIKSKYRKEENSRLGNSS